jgi:hypothetical protein
MSQHTQVEIRVKTRTPHSGVIESSVSVSGDDDFEVVLQAARATLVAMGFLPSTAERLTLLAKPQVIEEPPL